MDNFKFHKTAAVKHLLLQRGFHLEYLPFLNPIENMFSKWKEFTKRQCCNNETELIAAVMNGKNSVTASDCTDFIKNMLKYI